MSALRPDGGGRPGLHIEDTAIAEKEFGLSYDIHGGGMDLKFPHHESEIAIAQSLSALVRAGKPAPFARLWIHTGFLMVRQEKMSKSAGNMVFIKDFLAHHSPDAFRLMTLMHQYRSPLNYAEELARQAETAWESLAAFL